MIYEIIDVAQGTPEWIAMRYDHVTATDVPVILGVSWYKTAESLLKLKANKIEEHFDEATLQRFEKGHRAEDTARRILTDYHFRPMVLVSKKIPHLWASLDGFDIEKNIILECKWTGNKTKIRDAKKGGIAKDHFLQMQAQLIVSGAHYCVYYITDGVKYARQVVKPDAQWVEPIRTKSELFINEVRRIRSENI